MLAPYRITDDGVDINDSESHGTWRLTLAGVLKESSNTGMSRLGQLLTPQQRLDYMTAFRLGTTSEVDFPGEEPGYLGDNAPDWNAQTDYATTFGQGLTTTAIQTASVYQAIGNGGVRMPVSLVSGCRAPDGTITDAPATAGSQVVSPQAARETVDMLENVATKGWLAEPHRHPRLPHRHEDRNRPARRRQGRLRGQLQRLARGPRARGGPPVRRLGHPRRPD